MAGSKAGSIKRKQTILDRYGVNEDGKSVALSKYGTKGGKRKVKKGFAVMDKEKVREAGKTGGARSRRKYEQ